MYFLDKPVLELVKSERLGARGQSDLGERIDRSMSFR